MTRHRNKKISELINDIDKKITLKDVPFYEEINDIFLHYLGGWWDDMIVKIVCFNGDYIVFFYYLRIYLEHRYPQKTEAMAIKKKNYYLHIVELYEKYVL